MLLNKYFSSIQQTEEAQDTAMTDTMTNGDNTDELLEDDYGFSDILDPKLTLELETLKMEQLKVKEEQLQCKSRMLMLKRVEKRPLGHGTGSNRCILPDGKIIVRNSGDRNGDLDHSAGAGDSARSRACVSCGKSADLFCSRCGVTPYCSQTCQIQDWKDRHRAVCHNLARFGSDAASRSPVLEQEASSIQNPAPLRRPHAIGDQNRDRPPRRDEEESRVSDKANRNEHVRRQQDRPKPQANRSPYNQEKKGDTGDITTRNSSSPRGFNPKQSSNKSFKQGYRQPQVTQDSQPDNDTIIEAKPAAKVNVEPEVKPVVKEEVKPVVKEEVKPVVKPEVDVQKKPSPVSPPQAATVALAPVPKTYSALGLKPDPFFDPTTLSPQVNEKQDSPPFKLASVSDVTPTRKMKPKNYLIEQLSIGDTVLLSVDAKASDCKSTIGDYVCLSMHEKYQSDYQSLVENYTVDCDADQVEHKLIPGETCSYFNVEDSGWYRARCLNPTMIALIDGSKVVTVSATNKIRKLPPKYESIPEFCCLMEYSNNVEIGTNFRATLVSKTCDKYKVSLEDVDTGATCGNGLLFRWAPLVEYPSSKPVIPEVPRPAIVDKSRVLLVDATALDRAFVRPADTQRQTEYDDVVQNALLAGMKASPLKEPPVKGQTVIAKYSDGLHYRALCKRTHVAQNKYLLEYIDYGNLEVCRNLEDLFPCPPNLHMEAAPTQVSMIKLTPEGGEFTPPALEYVDKLKNSNEEMILSLPNGQPSAPSGSEALLKLVKNSEVVNKKIQEMCTPDWKKFQEKGGDVVEVARLMFSDMKYQELPSGPLELDILDANLLQGGVLTGCLKGDPHAEYVFNQLTQKMAEYCNSDLGREPYLPKLEELCIAQCPPYPQWFRAVLLEQVHGAGGEQARVCYLDYGNVETIPVTLLRKMLPEFVNDLPAVGLHLDVQDFPVNCSSEILIRAYQHLKINEEGRGVLHVTRVELQEPGVYRVQAPELLRDIAN